MEYVGVPAIVIICFLIGEVCKAFLKKKNHNQYIPVIVGISGGLLGCMLYWMAPELHFARHPIEAVAVGIVSGLASTGSHQLVKQLFKKKEEL